MLAEEGSPELRCCAAGADGDDDGRWLADRCAEIGLSVRVKKKREGKQKAKASSSNGTGGSDGSAVVEVTTVRVAAGDALPDLEEEIMMEKAIQYLQNESESAYDPNCKENIPETETDVPKRKMPLG